jgi:cellulose synthase/poly-beta-1,6-N-acetylglucosamine synthase-like glycosyltransferase
VPRPYSPPRAQLTPPAEPVDEPRLDRLPQETVILATIVIPARNEAARLPRCLEGLRGAMDRAGGPAAFEVIVVDHGSFDGTASIARAAQARVIDASKAPTIAAVRNRGAARSRGRVIAFLDADCVPDETWLVRSIAAFDDPTVVAVGYPPRAEGEASWIAEAGTLVAAPELPGGLPTETRWLPSANLIVRRTAFVAVGGFDDLLATCEDYDLTVRLRQRGGRLLSDPGLRVVHLREPQSVKTLFWKERWRGRASLQGAVRHGFDMGEVPSLVLPFVHVGALALVIGSLAAAQLPMACVAALAALLPSFALAMRAAIRARRARAFPALFVFFVVYSAGRVAALAPERSRRREVHAPAS